MKSSFFPPLLSLSLILAAAFFTGSAAAWGVDAIQDTAAGSDTQDSWGLSFQESGQPPTGNATAQELKKYNAFYLDDSGKKVIYLTFDAGYENGFTSSILDTLNKHQAPAAFFVVGNYISTSPDLVQRMVQEGHIVGNHTFSHPDMAGIASLEDFRQELQKLEELYRETTGLEMKKYYRPPQGRYSQANLEMARDLGYQTFFWSLAYVDWLQDQQPSREEALKKLLGRVHPGAIILLHSTSSTNAAILDELLTCYEQMGYDFGSLEDLVSSAQL